MRARRRLPSLSGSSSYHYGLGSVQLQLEVAERERRFYNTRNGNYRRFRNAIWHLIGPFNRNKEVHRLYDPRGKRVLLYGCGSASDVPRLAEAGAASITGIDISETEVAEARRQAAAGGYRDAVDLRVADAHDTQFPCDCFDLVVGTGILHHLDLTRALIEIRRIMAPGGRGVFLEPLAHNPLLRIARYVTPNARTPDEHPLTVDDWSTCAKFFPAFSHRELELTSIALMPLHLVLPTAWHEPLARRVSALDDRLLERHAKLRPLARSTLLILE